MSATRTIILGAALGLAFGAAALAQDTQTNDLGTDRVQEAQTGTTPDTTDLMPLPEGEALIAAADALIGTRVYDINDEWVGEVSEVIPATGTEARQIVIDIGGFLGFGETPVAVDADVMTVAWTPTGEVDHALVDMTEAEIEQRARSDS